MDNSDVMCFYSKWHLELKHITSELSILQLPLNVAVEAFLEVLIVPRVYVVAYQLKMGGMPRQ